MCLNIPANTVPDRGTEVLQCKASTCQKQVGQVLGQSEAEANKFSVYLDRLTSGTSLSHSYAEIMSLQPGQMQGGLPEHLSLQECDPLRGLTIFLGSNTFVSSFSQAS